MYPSNKDQCLFDLHGTHNKLVHSLNLSALNVARWRSCCPEKLNKVIIDILGKDSFGTKRKCCSIFLVFKTGTNKRTGWRPICDNFDKFVFEFISRQKLNLTFIFISNQILALKYLFLFFVQTVILQNCYCTMCANLNKRIKLHFAVVSFGYF